MSTACCALFSTTFEAQDLQRARRCTFSNIYGGDPASGDGVDAFLYRVVLHVTWRWKGGYLHVAPGEGNRPMQLQIS